MSLLTSVDGFLEPHTWENYDPNNPTASAPAKSVTVDTHQFWAFPPLDTLTEPEILEKICQFAQTEIRNPAVQGTPPTLVGEWSLSTGKARYYLGKQ